MRKTGKTKGGHVAPTPIRTADHVNLDQTTILVQISDRAVLLHQTKLGSKGHGSKFDRDQAD